ncbi:MAG: hypothetical protein A2Y77_10075 [Planctomycetes bacterium RBG_13_62_9]|nr:MAG: hypothetical protein A2Y77_10075 [Planctomycetes bacterium RBG_13_62_9]
MKKDPVFRWFRAKDISGNPALVQVLQPAVSGDPEQVKQLKEYFQAIPAGIHLVHPTQVLSDPEHGLVVGYPDRAGETLREALAREPRNAERWWGDACDAVFSLHKDKERGLVHGAITLDSFVVIGDKAFLTDFGYAPLIRGGNAMALARAGENMAPETQKRHEITAASDQYALAQAIAEWKPDFRQTEIYKKATQEEARDRYPRVRNMADELAVYLRHPQYRITVAVSPRGAGTVTGTGEYEGGKKVKVSAQAKEGWVFDHWSGDLTGYRNPETVTMDGHKRVTANFVHVPVTLRVEVEPPEAGTVQVNGRAFSGVGKFEIGQEISVEVTSVSGDWQFSAWSGDAAGSQPNVRITMDGDKTLVASFASTVPMPPVPMYQLAAEVAPPRSGKITGLKRCYREGERATVKALPGKGYRFERWQGNVPSGDETKNPLTVVMDSNRKLIAHFKSVAATVKVTAIVVPPTAGRVNGVGEYSKGAAVTLTAYPARTSVKFGEWAGDVPTGEERKNPIRLVVNSDVSLKAVFEDDQDSAVRRKVFLMMIGSPITLCPFMILVTALMALWAFNIDIMAGLPAFACTAGLMVNCGVLLTRLILGSEKLEEIAREEVNEETQLSPAEAKERAGPAR